MATGKRSGGDKRLLAAGVATKNETRAGMAAAGINDDMTM